MHICKIWKKIGIDDLIFKAEKETDIQKNVWIPRGEGESGWDELGDWD